MRRLSFEATWTHTICESCWFQQYPGRFPVMMRREQQDRQVDFCCFCGTVKVTRIHVREAPNSERLVLCAGRHETTIDDEERD